MVPKRDPTSRRVRPLPRWARSGALRGLLLAAALGLGVGLVACNTVEGAGEDLESVGEEVEETAEEAGDGH